jgi:hypothetical protein
MIRKDCAGNGGGFFRCLRLDMDTVIRLMEEDLMNGKRHSYPGLISLKKQVTGYINQPELT